MTSKSERSERIDRCLAAQIWLDAFRAERRRRSEVGLEGNTTEPCRLVTTHERRTLVWQS